MFVLNLQLKVVVKDRYWKEHFPADRMETITAGNNEYKLKGGKYFEQNDGGKTYQYAIENPDIFTAWWTKPTENNKAEENKLEDSGAAFSDLAGQVEINIPNPDGTYDEENWTSAKLNRKSLPVGTHIKTMEKSTAIISYSDMSTFILKPETEIVLSSPSARDSQIQLLYGNLMANVRKMLKDGTMQVEMSQAVAGIKGTRFITTENEKESKLEVTEGTVAFTHKKTKEKTLVSTGESVIATSKGFEPKTKFNPSSLDKEIFKSTTKSESILSQIKNIAIILIAVLLISFVFMVLLKKRKK